MDRDSRSGHRPLPSGGQRYGGEKMAGREDARRGDVRAMHGTAMSGAPPVRRTVETHSLPNPSNRTGITLTTGVKVHSRELEVYGVIFALKEKFGFIQALFEEEQCYFSDREFYDNMKVGDKVAYLPRASQKGVSAHNVRLLIPSLSKQQAAVQGTITRTADRHRSGFGLVEIDMDSVSSPELKLALDNPKVKKTIVYRSSDVVNASLPRGASLDRGDFVEFTVAKLHDSNLYFATEMKLKQSKRERAAALQIKRMLDAGAVREVGVVYAIKNKEYGFIRAQDRKTELYFRMDDVVEDTRIDENTEVEFFVIAEMVKGKLCDRAIHLKTLPRGTVKFEVAFAADALVAVTAEPTNGSNESPGSGRLLSGPLDVSAVTKNEKNSLTDVELWQRCLPEELSVRKGDILRLNVHYYRPEKLFFGRSVRMHSFFPLGRDTGVITSLREQEGFGFLHSEARKADAYFKMSQVISAEGELKKNLPLAIGQRVSFEMIVDNGRLRAVRLQLLATSDDQKEDDELCLLKDVLGVVVRTPAAKKDSVGLIQLQEAIWRRVQELEFVETRYDEEFKAFIDNDGLTQVQIAGLSQSLLRQYVTAVEKHKDKLKCEVLPSPGIEHMRNLKIWKEPSEAAGTVIMIPPAQGSATEDEPPSPVPPAAPQRTPKEGSFTIIFAREDTNSDFLTNDMEVLFDVYWDRAKGKKVARNLRVTDEPIAGEEAQLFGVVDVLLLDKKERFGYLCSIPSDEKLFWHSSVSLSKGCAPSALKVGRYVSFFLRRRGGLRIATEITLAEPPLQCERLPELVLALAVDNDHAVLVNVDDQPFLKERYVPLSFYADAMQTSQGPKHWAKAQLPSTANAAETEAAVGVDSSTASNPVDASSSSPSPWENMNAAGRLEYKPRYFGPLARLPIPILHSETVKPVPGDLFLCHAMMSPEKKRSPVDLFPVEIVAGEPKAIKRKARVSKLKFQLRGNGSGNAALSSRFPSQSLEFAEFLHVEDKSQGEVVVTGNVSYSYCEVNDIAAASADFTRDSLQVNDDIEYWVIPSYPGVAFGVKILPKMQHQKLKFIQGPGVNEQLKEQKSKSVNVTTNVIMAKGPPNDTTKGFEANWKTIDLTAIAALPWASLLSHLGKE